MTLAALQTVEDRLLGRTIAGKYRIVRLLGQGGMGSVYEARHLLIGRRFAIKFISLEYVGHAEALARFKREAEAAGMLEHENIAAVTDFGKAEQGRPYIVMEYLDGESLAEVLEREGPLPLAVAISISVQVAQGLSAAHARDIVHRDLKPANVFVTKRPDGSDLYKILDFGIAKLRDSADFGSTTRTGTALGTPHYMSPEQARGDKALDQRSDVYALGVMLYEMLTGRFPHEAEGYNAVLYEVLTGVPVRFESLRPDLPQGLADVIHRALAQQVELRYQSMAEVGVALLPFSGSAATTFELPVPRSHQNTVIKPPSEATVKRKYGPKYRLRAVLLALGVALGLLACLVKFALVGESSEHRPSSQSAVTKSEPAPVSTSVNEPAPNPSLVIGSDAPAAPPAVESSQRPESKSAPKVFKGVGTSPRSQRKAPAVPVPDPYAP